MRVSLSLGLAAAFSPAAALAQSGGSVLLRGVAVEGSRGATTGGGAIDVGNESTEAALLLEGRSRGFEWRLRGAVAGSVGEFPGDVRVRLNALSYGRQLTPTVYASIGKQQRVWGSGQSYQPLGFLRTQTNLRDPLDTEGRAEGVPMVYLSRLGDVVTVDAVYANSLQRGDRGQWALRASGQIGRVDASALIRRRDGDAAGVGGSATWAGEQFQIYGDVYYGPPERRPLVDDATGGAFLSGDAPSIGATGGRRLSAALGATWTPTATLTATAEIVRRGEGLSDSQFNRLFDRTFLADAALRLQGDRRSLAVLANTVAVLSGPPIRRDYLFLRGAVAGRRFGFSGNANIGLADGSASLTLIASWTVAPRTFLAITGSRLVGQARSEFGQSPARTVGTLTLRRTFDL
jgi:hypothetical protein